jgi:hypothetical protein
VLELLPGQWKTRSEVSGFGKSGQNARFRAIRSLAAGGILPATKSQAIHRAVLFPLTYIYILYTYLILFIIYTPHQASTIEYSLIFPCFTTIKW